mmetsp:Transcript_39412/g.71771  ORF Transcript_39412/g.71771 Transcript_39412/m.71771 type:complete len:247 (+) Transcript_39412:8239-8979(+)
MTVVGDRRLEASCNTFQSSTFLKSVIRSCNEPRLTIVSAKGVLHNLTQPVRVYLGIVSTLSAGHVFVQCCIKWYSAQRRDCRFWASRCTTAGGFRGIAKNVFVAPIRLPIVVRRCDAVHLGIVGLIPIFTHQRAQFSTLDERLPLFAHATWMSIGMRWHRAARLHGYQPRLCRRLLESVCAVVVDLVNTTHMDVQLAVIAKRQRGYGIFCVHASVLWLGPRFILSYNHVSRLQNHHRRSVNAAAYC